MAYFLPPQVDFFPHPLEAEEDGLLAMGASINVDTLLLAYQYGIFPWSNEGEPTFWYFTHPRCVLYPDSLRVTKSMRPYINGFKFSWSIDRDFKGVIAGCKNTNRKGQSGTWIYDEIETTFIELHKLGYAHSVEVWEGTTLVGGLYGLALGKVFFGESMFATVSNASKYGFINFVGWLKEKGFKLIDCQQRTKHIMSLGAETIKAESFLKILQQNILEPNMQYKWTKKK